MPNPGLSEPILKVTLNLFASDVDRLRSWYGHGWSEQVRLWVRQGINKRDNYSNQMRGVCGND